MNIAIMQPYLFPYLGYFQLMAAVDEFIILDDVNYITRGWINRNRVLVNGSPKLFSLPLKGASQNQLICEIEISHEYERWRDKFLISLRHQYGKESNFLTVISVIEKILFFKNKNLSAFLFNSLSVMTEYLSLTCCISRSSDAFSVTRGALNGQQRILDIVMKMGGSDYINAIGGMSLYDEQAFSDKGISLSFLKSKNIEYKQNVKDFSLTLSIIDLLMFNSPDELKRLLMNYKIVQASDIAV